MATFVVSDFKAAQELKAFLCKAAGINSEMVYEITCRVAIDEGISFSVEIMGNQESILRALEK